MVSLIVTLIRIFCKCLSSMSYLCIRALTGWLQIGDVVYEPPSLIESLTASAFWYGCLFDQCRNRLKTWGRNRLLLFVDSSTVDLDRVVDVRLTVHQHGVICWCRNSPVHFILFSELSWLVSGGGLVVGQIATVTQRAPDESKGLLAAVY